MQEDLLTVKLKSIAETLGKQINAKARSYGLTYTQCRVLTYLYGADDKRVTQRDIEELLGATHATVSVLVGRMKMRGLITVKSDPEDHRARNITLKDAKRNMLDLIANETYRIDKLMLDGFTDDEREKLDDYLGRIYENITQKASVKENDNA